MLNKSRTIAIVCGASAWPNLTHFESAIAFSNTAAAVREYLSSVDYLGLPKNNVLWLFDQEGAVKHYDDISKFLNQHFDSLSAPKGADMLILFWYVGHGAFFGENHEYCLLVRDTRVPIEAESSLRVGALAGLFRRVASKSSRLLILDCCFAGQASSLFQGSVDQLIAVKAEDALRADQGVSILCAASSRNPARLADPGTTTLFGGKLLEVLKLGDGTAPPVMSTRDVCGLVQARLGERSEDVPWPEIHSPDQTGGDLASVPLFPNMTTSLRDDANLQVRLEDRPGNLAAVYLTEDYSELGSPEALGVDELHSNNIITALSAARVVVAGGADRAVPMLLDNRTPLEWKKRLFRYVLASAARSSAETIVDRISAAKLDWVAAWRAAEMLSPSHCPYAKERLKRIALEGDLDSARLAIQGLGRIADFTAVEITIATAERSSDYLEKCVGYTTIALARMFQSSELADLNSDHWRTSLSYSLRDFIIRHAKLRRQLNLDDVSVVFRRRLRPWHADELLRNWISSDEPIILELGATALGYMKLVRATRLLLDRAEEVDPQLSGLILNEVGRIGGIRAYRGLIELLESETLGVAARGGLALCLDSAPDDEFEEITHRLLLRDGNPSRWSVYRAIGIRARSTLVHHLEAGLNSKVGIERGAAALAIARCGVANVSELATRAFRESSDDVEQVLTGLARLLASRDPAVIPSFMDALTRDACHYEISLFEDAVSVLEIAGGHGGRQLAEALRWVRSAL